MFPSASGVMIQGGTFNVNQTNRTSRGPMDILLEWVATGAFHNSDELYDAPKCHPHTRVAVLDDIMKWVCESESEQEDFMLWLFGPAGAGKSAIAKRIAEIAAERDILIADFFFSKSSSTRNTKDRLIATLVYQLTISIPATRSCIEDAIERDPVIFNKNILTQIDTLLIKPLQYVLASTQIVPCQKLIIIDGLDECNDSQAQVAILEALSRSVSQHNLPIKFLVVSRPEPSLVTSFTSNELLKSIHRRLALDDTYQPYDDIHLFFSDKFEQIRLTHPLKSTIPTSWPTQEMLETLIKKSSGQFIYASTVVKFVESICHRPSSRLNIILGISPPGRINPFAELDALYNHLLSSVDDIELTLRVLSLYVMPPNLAYAFNLSSILPELLPLEPGDIQLALINLSSILTFDEISNGIDILHASFIDFLSDKRRSTIFYIDMASICTDLVRRVLQYAQGNGIPYGNSRLLSWVYLLSPWILKGQLRSDILNFDYDAFIDASTRWRYNFLPAPGSRVEDFDIWMKIINLAGLDERDTKEALDRLNRSFESRLQIYQSDWRLQLLLTLTLTDVFYWYVDVPYCKYLDILLEMAHDHDLHLIDRNALDLRHAYSDPWGSQVAHHVDGGTYASAALHCMRFISNPPEYSQEDGCYHWINPGDILIYKEWKATCAIVLDMLCGLLQRATASQELVQFISNRDIHPAIQKEFSLDYLVREVNLYILEFLSRGSMCPNWRIISAIQGSLQVTTHWPWPRIDKRTLIDENGGWVRYIDQCCLNVHLAVC